MSETLRLLKDALIALFPEAAPDPGKQLQKEIFGAAVKGAQGRRAFLRVVKKVNGKSFFGLAEP